jgi:hypothetical protein
MYELVTSSYFKVQLAFSLSLAISMYEPCWSPTSFSSILPGAISSPSNLLVTSLFASMSYYFFLFRNCFTSCELRYRVSTGRFIGSNVKTHSCRVGH